MQDRKIDLSSLPAWQQYLIGATLVIIVSGAAWIVGKDNPIPPWITNCLLPALAAFGLLLIILAVGDSLRKRRSGPEGPEE